jgi:transposase
VDVKTKAKNEIHAALMRGLIARPKPSDPFGVEGRGWLKELAPPAEEREPVDASRRRIEFCESEIAAIDRVVAVEALSSSEIRRLMTVPGMG